MLVVWRCVRMKPDRLQWIVQAQRYYLDLLAQPSPRNGQRPMRLPEMEPRSGERRDKWEMKRAIAFCASRLVGVASLADFLSFLTPSTLADASIQYADAERKSATEFSRATVGERFRVEGTKRSFDLSALLEAVGWRLSQIGAELLLRLANSRWVW